MTEPTDLGDLGDESLLHDRDALAAGMQRLERVVADRLGRWKRGINLLTYEGTLLDRVVYELVRRRWSAGELQVICSVRPCMLPQLVGEVRAFAAEHRYPIADFTSDCSARYPWLAHEPRACENVSAMIFERLTGSGGLLVSSALLNTRTAASFAEVNEQYAGLYVFDTLELARYCDTSAGRDWHTLFLLQGFGITEVIAAYLTYVSPHLDRRHLPVCYLDCYNEDMQREMIAALPALTARVGELRQAAPQR